MEVQIQVLPHFDKEFPLPQYETAGASGMDLRAALGPGESFLLKAGEKKAIPTGLAFQVPVGYEAQVRPRSGLSLKTGLMVVNSPGTIDADYRGEVKVILGNLGLNDELISHGDRIAQLVFAPIIQVDLVQVEELGSTERGAGGFGSTGAN